MNGSVLHYGIEFVSNKIAPQDISTQTSDFIPVLLIVFAVAAALSSAFLIYRKLCASNANISLATIFNNKFIKSKSAAIVLGIFLVAGALFCFSIKQAHAADSPDNLQRIIVVIDEEAGTLSPQNAVFENDTCYQTKFLKSSVDVLPAGEKFADLDETDFLLWSENGLVFEGEADEEIYDNSKCLPFKKGEKYNLNLNIDNISFETASKLVGLGPVFQIDIQCEIYCMVCFDEQGHGIAPEPQIVQLFDQVEQPENLHAKYYNFDGWFCEPECINTFGFDDAITSDTIIYAGWTSKFESEFEKQILSNPEYATYVAENKISVNIQTADGQMEFSYNGDKQASSASMIKLLILAEFMEQVDSGNVKLNDCHIINQTDKSTGGAGHINGFALGTRVPYDDIAKFMIMYSDNAASNVLIDLLGKEQINAKAAELGLKCTVLSRKLIVETPPPDNFTCAEDCATILDGIYNKTIASRFMCDKAISYLKQQTDKAAMGQVFKDHNIVFAHKTGNLLGKVNVRHDAGIAYTKNPFIISCIIELPEGQANPIHQKIAEIAINTIN